MNRHPKALRSRASDRGAAGARRGDLLALLGAARRCSALPDLTPMAPTVSPSRTSGRPPGFTTETSSGCPISPGFRSAASMTRRASPGVTGSLVFATSAV
jgi:hypothetical protein